MKLAYLVLMTFLASTSALADGSRRDREEAPDVLGSRSGLHWAVQSLEEGGVWIEQRNELGEVTAEFEVAQTSAGIRIDRVTQDGSRSGVVVTAPIQLDQYPAAYRELIADITAAPPQTYADQPSPSGCAVGIVTQCRVFVQWCAEQGIDGSRCSEWWRCGNCFGWW
ncbi:MAG: hypothetical protein ABW252_20185 [Polyangiales bacterium]